MNMHCVPVEKKGMVGLLMIVRLPQLMSKALSNIKLGDEKSFGNFNILKALELCFKS